MLTLYDHGEREGSVAVWTMVPLQRSLDLCVEALHPKLQSFEHMGASCCPDVIPRLWGLSMCKKKLECMEKESTEIKVMPISMTL